MCQLNTSNTPTHLPTPHKKKKKEKKILNVQIIERVLVMSILRCISGYMLRLHQELIICKAKGGETVETVSDFIFGGSKITAGGDCHHEIKRRLLLGRKVMTSLDSIFKSRDITLPTKVRLVKAMVFPMVMYGCESWTVKKAERQRIDAFELWCWRRLLRSLGLQGDPTSPF